MMMMKRTVMKLTLTSVFIVTKQRVTQQDRDDDDDDDKDDGDDNNNDDNDDDDDKENRNENDLDNCFHSNQIYSNPVGQR